MAKAPKSPMAEHDGWPVGISHNDGFRLLGTPLGFRKNPKAGLLFFSHHDSVVSPRKRRILTTAFAAAALGAEQRGLDVLAPGFHRQIRLGKLDLELWPSGMGPEGAQLLVGFKERSILYCDGIRLSTPGFGPHAEVPQCDILMIDFSPSAAKPPSPKNTLQKLSSWTKSVIDAGKTPVLACENFAVTTDVLWHLRKGNHTVRAVRSLFEKARRCQPLGLELSNLRRLEQSIAAQSIVLHRARSFEQSPLFHDDQFEVAYAGPAHNLPQWAKNSFRLGETEDRAGIAKYVAQTGAHAVALGPNCDDATSTLLQNKGFDVYRVLPPEQIPLPLPSTA